jgi:Phage integrase, N-terminal SAM-like domain
VTPMSRLRRRLIEDMTVRNLSRSTQQSNIYAVGKFRRHFNRPSDRIDMEDVRAYQLHLIEQKFPLVTHQSGRVCPAVLVRLRGVSLQHAGTCCTKCCSPR